MTEQPVGVTITLADIYAKICTLEERVQEMTPQGKAIADHEQRLRSIERWKYAVPPSLILAVVSTIVTIVQSKG